MGKVDDVSKHILKYLLDDFQTRRLGADVLHTAYEGVKITDVKQKCLEGDKAANDVDFELSLKDLEDQGLVRTGPVVPFENKPGSGVFAIGTYSKREHVGLTDKGYRAAR
jgi:hypothetical protein